MSDFIKARFRFNILLKDTEPWTVRNVNPDGVAYTTYFEGNLWLGMIGGGEIEVHPGDAQKVQDVIDTMSKRLLHL